MARHSSTNKVCFHNVFNKDFKEMLASEIISMTGGLFTGLMLAVAIDKIFLIPGMFILIPGFMEMRGNISGSLSARLGSGLWLNALKPRWKHNRILMGNIIGSFTLAMVIAGVLGVVAWFASSVFFGVGNISLIFIAFIAGIISNAMEIPMTIATTFWLFSHGHDPNNIMGPYITTIGDIISVISILMAIVII